MGYYGAIQTRAARAIIGAVFCIASNGCASLKSMTSDFNRKWDDPKTAMAELEEGRDSVRSADSSAEQMAAINANDCARRFGLHDPKSDDATLTERRRSAGECLLGEGRNEDAVRMFSIALEDGDDAIAMQGKGVALVRLGRIDEATTALEAALAIDPTLWRAWNALGVAKDGAGASEEAWDAFQRAADLNGSDGAALNSLGVSKLTAGLTGEAIAAFKSALERQGVRDAAEANLRLAIAYNGDYAGAVRALPDQRRAVALNNAGVAAVSRGDSDEARRLFTKAIEESPHFYAKAYNNLSLLLE